MSHPLHNPYNPGKQSSSQGENELSSGQADEDLRRTVPSLGPGSSFSSSGTLSVSSRLGISGTVLDNKSKSALDMNLCAREETRHQPLRQGAFFASTQRDILSSFTTAVSTHLVSSASQEHQHSITDRGGSSLNWLPKNKSATKDSFKSTSNLLDPSPSPVDQPVFPKPSSPSCNTQLAEEILRSFGLDKEDLDELLDYPEDQTTAENLPHILQKIHIKKIERTAASLESGLRSTPSSRTSEMNRSISFGQPGTFPVDIPDAGLQPLPVSDHGNTGGYIAKVEGKIGETMCQTGENMWTMDSFKNTSHIKEAMQKGLTETQSGGLVSSKAKMDSVASLNLRRTSVAPSSSGPTKLQTPLNQTLQTIFTRFSALNKDGDIIAPTPEVLKPVPLKEPVHQFACKTLPPIKLEQNVISGQTVLVEMQHDDDSCANGQSKTQRRGLNSHQTQQNQVQKLPMLQKGQVLQSAMSHAAEPSAFNISQVPFSKWRSPAKNPASKGLPPLAMMQDCAAARPRTFSHTCSLCNKVCAHMKDWLLHQKTSSHLENCKRLQEQYPEWNGKIPQLPSVRRSRWSPPVPSAQTSQHHQKSRRRSRSRSYSPSPRCSGDKRGKSRSSSTSSSYSPRHRSSRDRRRKSSSSSRSRSYSPRRQCRRERNRNRRQSLQSRRHSLRSRSRSYERRSSLTRKFKKSVSPRRSHECRLSRGRSKERQSSRDGKQRSPRRSEERQSSRDGKQRSPRRSKERQLSHGRSKEQQSSIRDGKQESPRRSKERQSSRDKKLQSPRRSKERRLPPRSRERQSSHKREDDKQSSHVRRLERQWSSISSDENLWSPKRSCGEQSSPRQSEDKQGSPTGSHEQQRSPKSSDDKRRSPVSSHEQQSSPRRDEAKKPSLEKSDEGPSSVKRSCKRQSSLEESSSQEKSCSVQRLTEQLLENSVVQSLSGQHSIEDVVKLVVPVLLAELAKRNPSSPSTSQARKRKAATASSCASSSSSKAAKVQPKPQGCEANSCSKPKLVRLDKPSPPTMVKLKGTFDSLCRNDVVAAVESFGKTKSVLLLKSKQEAAVCFENEKDAEKLRSTKSLDVKGVSLTVVTKKGSVSECAPDASTEKTTQQKCTRESSSAGNLVLLPVKTLISLPTKPQKTTASELVKKPKVCVSQGNEVSSKQVVSAVTTGSVAVKRAKASKPSGLTFRSPEQRPGSSDANREKTKILKKKENNSGFGLKRMTKVKNIPKAVPKPVKGKKIVTKKKIQGPKTGRALKSTGTKKELEVTTKRSAEVKVRKLLETKVPQIQSSQGQQPSSKDTEETATKINNMTSESPVPENQPDGCKTFETKHLESKLQESAVEAEDSVKVKEKRNVSDPEVKVSETRNVSDSDVNLQAEVKVDVQLKKEKEADSFSETGVVEGPAEDIGVKPTVPEVSSAQPKQSSEGATTPDEPLTPPPQKPQDSKTPETAVRALSRIKLVLIQNPDSISQKPKTEGKTLEQQTSESSAEAAPSVETVEKVEIKTSQTDAVSVAKTNKNPASQPLAATSTSDTKTTAAKSEKPPAADALQAVDSFLIVGEKIDFYIKPINFNCVMAESVLSSGRFALHSTLLLITNLPVYRHAHYTETEVANLLCQFGFKYEHDNVYVFPVQRVAFALMPNERSVMDVIRASVQNRLKLGQRNLLLHIVEKDMLMTPLGFYNSLMELTPLRMKSTGSSLIYIRNISSNEIRDLREALEKIGSFRTFLPLLNKVFVEFETIYDADRLGVWYSFLKRGTFHVVERLKLPYSPRKSKPPQQPMKALPDGERISPGAEIPTSKYGIPQGTASPFWVTMTTIPYVFPTASPWFNIPDYLTVRGKNDLSSTTLHPGSVYSTVMLTGLPEANYKHEDVAKLVWPYFSTQNLQTLYYNILVLPLQRRAFVFFCTREACCSFVRDHIRKPVSVGGRALQVHFILQDIRHEASEVMMYGTLMKWSNAHVPEVDFLENRLLCVELFETNVDLIKRVVKEVASMGCFVNFLPLANRICIEMVDSSSLRNVLEAISQRNDLSTHRPWSKVRHVESFVALKQRLQDSSEITINLQVNMSEVTAEPTAVRTRSQLQLSECPATEAKPGSAESTISMSEAVSQEKAAEPPSVSKSEIKPVEKPAEPPSVSKSEIKPVEKAAEPPGVSKSEIKPVEKPAEPSSVSKSEIKPVEKAAEPPGVSKSEIKPVEKPAEPSSVSKSEIKPVQKPAEPPSVSKSEIKPVEKAAEPSSVSKSEIKPVEKPAEPPSVSKSEIKPVEKAAEPSSVSKSEIKPVEKPAEPPGVSKSEIKPVEKAAEPSSVSKSEIKPVQKPAEPPSVSKSEIKPVEKAAEPPSVSKSEIKPVEKAAEPPVVIEPLKPVLASKAGTAPVMAPQQSSEETSSAADPVTLAKIQTDSATNPVSKVSVGSPGSSASIQTEPTAVAATKTQPAAAAASSSSDSSLTAGERIESLLHPKKISCLGNNIVMSTKHFSVQTRLLLITNLPKYHDGYTEEDVIKMLLNFGYQFGDKNIYVVPQTCMAFALMPSYQHAKEVVFASKNNHLTLNGSLLDAQIVSNGILMTPFGFYKSLMDVINSKVTDDGTSTVYIQNISPCETRDLRETLRKIQCVKNILPLLNKVFIEFETVRDADRIGVWYSLLKHCPAHNIYRMKIPRDAGVALAPRLAAKALPDSEDLVTGAVVPTTNCGVPQGSAAPFSVTMTTYPFVFPTASPWFIIPHFETVESKRNSWKPAAKLSAVMLTGLPETNYKHEDVAKLVWRYFTRRNLQTLYYNILVLPLQRRAFVYFDDLKSYSSFIEDKARNPVSVKDYTLSLHLVLQDMPPVSSEDIMYRMLMKWSNAHVPELETLQERLVCVELVETSVHLIIGVMKGVTNIAPIVSFLPLANRICIEMAEPSGVTRVVESISHKSPEWNKVRRVESLKSLNQRLQDSSDITVNLDLNTNSLSSNPPAVKTGPQSSQSETPKEKPQPAPPAAAERPQEVPSATQTSQISEKNLVSTEANQEIQATTSVPSKSTVSERQPDASGTCEGSAVDSCDENKAAEIRNETAPENKEPTEPVKAESEQVKALELMGTGTLENTKDKGSTETKEKETPSAKTSPIKPCGSQTLTNPAETTPPKPPTDPPQRPQTTLRTQTAVKPSSDVQIPIKLNPTSAARKTSQTRHSAARNLVQVQIKTSSPDVRAALMTLGERPNDFHRISAKMSYRVSLKTILSGRIFRLSLSLMLMHLPKFDDSCYTEADIINLLRKYDIQCEEDKIFVIPSCQVGFVLRPNAKKVQNFFRVSTHGNMFFRGYRVRVCVFCNFDPTLLGFYRLIRLSLFKKWRRLDPENVVFIQNVSPSEDRDLRKALEKIGGVRSYLPLLNKVMVEFANPWDADRLGVWYSFLKQRLPHSVSRIDLPPNDTVVSPVNAAHALPDRDIRVAWASIPKTGRDIPKGTSSPFWVTMTTSPYVFSTMSPWFNIPAYSTVCETRDLERLVKQKHGPYPVVMLTGLPNKTYTHEDVAKLVWRYFPEQNLHTLFNNVMVLPLQRRAFVYFNSWEASHLFLRDHIKNPVSLKDCALVTHFVLNNVHPHSSEESMYRNLMSLSNIHIPDLKSLEERLLCVEVSGTNEQLVTMVMKEVASIATFASFLPLANRIYIEMAESSGVTKVVENLTVCKLSEQPESWKQVGRIEALKMRKHRLQDCKRILVNLEKGTIDVYSESSANSAPSDEEAPKTSSPASAEPVSSISPTVSESITAGGAALEEESKAEVTVDSSISVKTEVETTEEKREEAAACCTLGSRGLGRSDKDAGHPQINMEEFNVLKAAILEFRRSSVSAQSKKTQEDTKEEVPPPELLDETGLNIEDLVTIDELNEDVEDKDSSFYSSEQTSQEKQCSDKSSAAEKILTESSETSSSSSSKNTNIGFSSSSTSVSVKKEKHSLEPNESQTNPSASVSDSKTSPIASLKSVESQRAQVSSTGQNTRSAAAATRTSGDTLSEKQKDKPTVGTSDYKVSTENNTTKSESETKRKPPSEVDSGLQASHGVKGRDAAAAADTGATAKEGERLVKDEGLAVRPDQATRVSEKHEKQNPPTEQDKSPAEDEETGKSLSERSVRRTTRGAKDQKTIRDEPAVMTRSTRGRRTIPAEESANERKERESLMRTKRTPSGRHSQEQIREKNAEGKTYPKDITPTKTTDTFVMSADGDFRDTEEEKETAAPRKRGRAKKTVAQTPVRKSTRRIKPESSDGRIQEGREGCSRDDVFNKRGKELLEPEAKRSRSQSPRVAANFKLPPFNPKIPLGKEFVSHRWGYFCNLCSVSYLNENNTEDQHCNSQTHRENLQKYHQKLQQKPSRISTRKSRPLSD